MNAWRCQGESLFSFIGAICVWLWRLNPVPIAAAKHILHAASFDQPAEDRENLTPDGPDTLADGGETAYDGEKKAIPVSNGQPLVTNPEMPIDKTAQILSGRRRRGG